MEIDITFNFRTDANGRDSDTHGPILRRYHRLLWSKPLPGGTLFNLTETTPQVYLYHRSSLGEFYLSSGSVITTFTERQSLKQITERFPKEDNDAFMTIAYTMGGMMVFPGNQISGKQTVNGARGFTLGISDRFNLTLQCIHRFFFHLDSPLATKLSRYADFSALFYDFPC